MLARRAIWSLSALVMTCCTFGSLADYEVATCNPGHQSQSEDECDVLNHGNTTACSPYQCDKTTSHCIQRVRDDDRDGNPPASCGGTDCDDHDPLNGGSVELCDGRDNNCNGLIDDGISYVGAAPAALQQSAPSLGSLPDPSVTGDSLGIVGSVVATSSEAAQCIDAFGLDSSSADTLLGAQNAGCSFLAAQGTLSPRQPVTRRLAGGAAGSATVFVETSGCLKQGALGYRWFEPPSNSGAFDLPCPTGTGMPASGVALPTLEDLGGNATTLFFYDVPISNRDSDSVIGNCAALAAAPLYAMSVEYGAKAPGPIVKVTDGIATVPPGTLPLAPTGALVAAPVEATKAASVFLVRGGGTVSELAPLPDFAGARGVGLAAGPKDADGSTPIAIVGELGCAPQTIVIAFGKLSSGASPSLTVGAASPVVVATAGHRAFRPTVAWQQDAPIAAGTRSEWLVAWTVDSPGVAARRYAATGVPLSGAFDVGAGVIDPIPSRDGRVFAVDAAHATFSAVSLRCAGQ